MLLPVPIPKQKPVNVAFPHEWSFSTCSPINRLLISGLDLIVDSGYAAGRPNYKCRELATRLADNVAILLWCPGNHEHCPKDVTMMSRKVDCLQALQLSQDLADEDCTGAISKLVSLAATEKSPSVSLRAIHDTIRRYEFAAYLEPLDILPALLPCRHDGAIDLIRLCAQNHSPKEVMIVLQEAIEYLQTRLNYDGEEANDPDLVQRTIGVVLLCSPAISRSRLGKKSALELCSPVVESVTLLITSTSPLATRDEGRVLISEVATMIRSLSLWASTAGDANGLPEIKRLLRELLDTTVVSCASSIEASLAIRACQARFPRSFVPSKAGDFRGGESSMSMAKLALESLGDTPNTIPWKPSSFSDLVYLAHSTTPLPVAPSSLGDFYRLLVGALQMNMVLDEALVLLFRALSDEDTRISPEIMMSFCTAFTALASSHLDPIVRQLNLRLLSLTLSKLPPSPRFEILLRLTTDEDFPQIRGPAVGLVKEAVLEALALPSDESRNPFASEELLRRFGGVLFRPNPPEFFNERKTREELAQSLELLRLADCLSFYYVLLQRDRQNKTGVRSRDNTTSVQGSILRPLRQFLDEHIGGEEQPLMAVSSLGVCLDRIDDALAMLDLEDA